MEYQKIYERYYTTVYRLSLLLLKNVQDAEDVAQSVFLKVMEKQPAFSDEEHARAWLLAVTRNHCRDVARSFWHRHRADLEHLPEPAAAESFDRQAGLLFEIFQTLPKKQREAVYFYYFEEYSIKEIAKLLNRKESTIQSQLFAARKHMKKQFLAVKTVALILCLAAAPLSFRRRRRGCKRRLRRKDSGAAQTASLRGRKAARGGDGFPAGSGLRVRPGRHQ